jgi:hypothetical protein
VGVKLFDQQAIRNAVDALRLLNHANTDVDYGAIRSWGSMILEGCGDRQRVFAGTCENAMYDPERVLLAKAYQKLADVAADPCEMFRALRRMGKTLQRYQEPPAARRLECELSVRQQAASLGDNVLYGLLEERVSTNVRQDERVA